MLRYIINKYPFVASTAAQKHRVSHSSNHSLRLPLPMHFTDCVQGKAINNLASGDSRGVCKHHYLFQFLEQMFSASDSTSHICTY